MDGYPVVGAQGIQGVQGQGGPTGPKGPQGHRGEKGEKGDRGDDGFTITGPRGMNGPKGDDGAPGTQGPIGPKGDKGDTGPRGMNGPKGDDGRVIAHDGAFTYIGPKGEVNVKTNNTLTDDNGLMGVDFVNAMLRTALNLDPSRYEEGDIFFGINSDGNVVLRSLNQ
jgi:Collagen triple helix repeat (20 copies)